MFQSVEEFHQVPTSVDDLSISIRLTKHTRDVQRRTERASRRAGRGRVSRLESAKVLDTPEMIVGLNYTIYDQDGVEMARGNVEAKDILTEQELSQIEKIIRRIYAEAEKEILGNE